MLQSSTWPIRIARLHPHWWRYSLGLFLIISLVVGGLVWERSRRLQIPPQAQHVTEQLLPGQYRRTSFWVNMTVEEVRSFYQDALTARGWRYCGTQDTPGCSKMRLPEAARSIDVYRRSEDRDATGVTIEIWPMWNDRYQHTFVTVFETSLTFDPPGPG